MTRVTKNPVERKQELVDTAERLFLEKGYEQTAISDIVGEIGVAQGTFYYYFASKADVLEAVVEKTIATLEEELRAIMLRSNTDTPEKLNGMINTIFRHYRSKEGLIDCVHQEGNTFLHEKMKEMTHAKLVPQLIGVVAEGVAEGRFSVPYPEEAAEVILDAVVHSIHRPDLVSDRNRRTRVRITLEHMLVSLLGVGGHSFALKL